MKIIGKATLLVMLGALLGASPFTKINLKNPDDILINSIKFRDLLHVIKTDYVEPTNADSLTDSALENMLEALDPHSVYIPKSEVKYSKAQLENDFEGIGVELTLYADTLFVSSVAPDGPAHKSGIKAGDAILFVDTKQVTRAEIFYHQLADLIRGPRGTEVKLTLHRYGEPKPKKISVVRDKIQSKSVEYYGLISHNTGIIKITRFTHATHLEVEQAIDDLKAKGIQQLMLDLRDNAGGYVSSAIKVADLFLDDKKLIYYTKGRNEEHDVKAYATEKGNFEKGALIVLINEKTASAAEIVTGALQDNDRALVVGRRSFGKGLVQAPVVLTDGSEVRLTIARYFTPSGRCIQKGYQRGKRNAYFKDLELRYKRGEYSHPDSMKVMGRPVFSTLKGRKVLGGGGIIPDVFIAKDTTYPEQVLQYLHENMVLNYYGQKLYKQYQHHILQYELPDFTSQFSLSPNDLTFVKQKILPTLATTDQIKLKSADNHLHTHLKAVIAKCMWQWNGYYDVQLRYDREIQTGLKHFKYAELLANL